MHDNPMLACIPFTPDGDSKNELWQPLGYGYTSLGYTIFDRWGHVVFTAPESKSDVLPWDGRINGKLVPNGTYTYLIIVDPYNARKKEIRGQVNVIW